MDQRASKDRAEAIRRLFDELVECAPEEQVERLAAIGDTALRQEVASLLDAYDRSGGTITTLNELRALLTHPASDDDPSANPGAAFDPFDPKDPLALVDKQVRRYAIEAHLGGGGMGVVYRARDTRLGRTVALKFLPPHLSAHPEAKERFMREARAASALDHPNIGTIHEINETKEGQLFIAMVYYAGETLKAKIARGPLPVDEAIGYATQIANALARAHEAGIIHRDVKPANVMVTERGRVKLVDFGLARATGQPELPHIGQAPSAAVKNQSQLTRTGQALGTAAYMSPEQAKGEAVGARTDLWSLGVVLYEMLTGQRPFGDSTHPQAAIYAILNDDDPAPIDQYRGKVPEALEAVIKRCLEKRPDERYATAGAVLDDLQAAHENAAVPSLGAVLRRARLHPTARRRIIGATATLLVLLGVVVSWALWPSGPGPIDAVAVLPLTSPSGNAEEAYFTYGMTEALTTALSQVGALSIRSLASTMRYANTEKPLPAIARELGVDALVRGSVFQADGRVRITVRLHGPNGEPLWSDSYERELRDVLALQGEVARAIAEEVQVALAPEEEARLARTRPVDPEAHRQWLIGNYHLTLQDEATFRKALDAYHEAIDIDPGYAQAYAGMALAYTELGSWHASIPPENVFPKAEAAAQQALALDSTVAEAHIALARVQQLYRWDWAGADRAFRRGIALNPSSTPARLYYAGYLIHMRRFDESIAFGRETLALDPLSPAVYTQLAFPLMFTGREEEARDLCRGALKIDPDFRQIHHVLALLHAQGDHPEKALPHLAKLEETDNEGIAHAWGVLGYLYAKAGRPAKARTILTRLMERRQSEYIPAVALAYIHLGLGEHDAALHWLDEAVAQRHPTVILLNAPWPWYDSIRSDPRFQALIDRMNFPPSQAVGGGSAKSLADPLSGRDGIGARRAIPAELLPEPSVVVLPLENLSGDPDQAYFADGMTDAIISNLARIEALRVISRKTAMHYKGSDASLPAIASDLGVRYVVDGAVFSTADSVRITASLVEAAADRTLWAGTFTREVRSVLGLQRAVARAVAEGIEVELAPGVKARLAQAPEVDPAAYRHYQRGVQIRAEERGGWRRAREHFKRAVAVDSSFALAWAWLAKMHAILGTTGTRTEEDLKREAEETVEKALALDPDLAEACVALGLLREILDLDGARAEQAFVRAIELEPGNQEAHFEYGMLLMRMGRMDEALAEMKRALAVDPFSMHVHHGMIQVYAFNHQFEKAIQQAQSALDIEPGDLESMGRLARTYVFAERFEEAEAAYRRLEAMDGVGDYEGSFWEAYLHARKGQPAKARAWIEARENGAAPFWIAWLYAGLGEIDLAVDTLEKAYQAQPDRWNFEGATSV